LIPALFLLRHAGLGYAKPAAQELPSLLQSERNGKGETMCNNRLIFLDCRTCYRNLRWKDLLEEAHMKFKGFFSAFSSPFSRHQVPWCADEMWTTMFPEPRSKYGFEVSDAGSKEQLASVRFNSGGSGSFVSADGLVLTDHIASDVLHKISTAENDYNKEGFYARTRAQEVKAPDLELNQLISIEDVTERVNSSVKTGASPAEANAARRAAIANIEKESTEKTGLRSDVVTLYQGGQYNLTATRNTLM
jgi:hypothetical protein